MSDTYSIYPITMCHPHFKPAKSIPVPGTEIRDQHGNVTRQDYRGTPQVLPPVTARDENEEEYWKAQGYERAGKIDPSAWVRAHSDAPAVDFKPVQYPKWVNGKLYMTAQEDPGATVEDIAEAEAPAAEPEAEGEPLQPSEVQNLRAQMEQMQAQMVKMATEFRETKQENARLSDALTEAQRPASRATGRPPGRPRKVAEHVGVEAEEAL